MKLLLGIALAASLVAGCTGYVGAAPVVRPSDRPVPSGSAVPLGKVSPKTAPTTAELTRLIGQKLVIRMDGATPSADLLGRIRRGEVGGVILLGFNITTRSALVALTAKLQAAATDGHQPPLLIAVDQEGGEIKRIAWAPPTLSPPQIGDLQLSSVARTQGAQTGAALHDLGINVDFAPVADVPASTTSFMYLQGRTFSFSATRTSTLADAFATGLGSGGVVPTMKHFPGLGFATKNTDAYVVKILQSKDLLAAGLRPYRTAIAHDIPLIMLSNATYSAYDPVNAAGWSRAIGTTLLRDELGFTGVTITDSLDGTAHARGLSTKALAVKAAMAGTDMILMTGSEATTRAVFTTLLRDAESGELAQATLHASYERILALKAGL
jgi:beta-N-acetylhexosaminidase